MEIIKDKVKILQICAIDLSVDALLKPLILASMKEGYVIHTACSNQGKFKQLKQEGLTLIDISIERKISLLSNLKSIWKLYKLMKKEKYDIVHVHTPIAALLGRVAAKLAGVKNIIYTAHGYYFHEEMSIKTYRVFYLIEKFAARFMTDWLLLQSKEDYDLSVNDKFKPTNRIIHLSNGVDIWNKFDKSLLSILEQEKLKETLKIQNGEIVFTFIGRLVKEKGIFELVQAFNSLNLKYPNIRLLLIGDQLRSERDQDSYNKLKEEMNNPSIIQVGFQKDIPLYLSISDVFILPSYREGLPRSIIEAMAMSIPIIATNIRGCREEVFNEINGFLVNKGNTESLIEAMEKFIKNPQLFIQYGIKSREICEKLYDEQKVITKQLELFEKITCKV